MKKFLAIILIGTLSLGLTACVNDDDTKDPIDVVTCEDDETKVNETCVKNDTLDLEALTTALDEFTLTDTLSEITSDMTLPTTIGENINITWNSSNPSIISNDGTVTRPFDADTSVVITATATLNTQELTKEFNVTVLKQKEAPVLNVNDEAFVTIIKGDSTSLEGASATDANDGVLTDEIELIGTFDINSAGFYNVTLKITDSDGEFATKNVLLQVKYEAPVIVTGETWGKEIDDIQSLLVFDVIENFTDGDTFNVSFNDGLISRPTLFINTSTEAKTVNVINGYAVAAIFNANGVVIEGRDGANGRLVNEACGLRVSCAQGSLTAADPVQNLVLEPGGFALVAPNNNTDYNEDGRKFVNEQIINRIDKVVSLTVNDQLIYTEADQAPFFVIGGQVKPQGSFTLTGTKDVTFSLLDGVSIYDWDATANDGEGAFVVLAKTETFDPVKSVIIYDELGNEVTVTDYTAFVFTASGAYDIEYTIQDAAGNERTIETQISVIVFEELASPAFRILDTSNNIITIDLMKVGYDFNFEDTDDIDTAKYHVYKDYQALLNDTTNAPHKMGWGSFIIFDEATGIIEVNMNIFHGNLFVKDGVDYIDTTLFTDAEGLKGITSLPEGKVLLVGPQNTDMRAFALSNTSRDLTGMKIEFINVDEIASVMPTYDVATIILDNQGTPEVIDITGYKYNATIAGTNNMPTGASYIVTDYNLILGLDGTPLNMGWGSYLVIDNATQTIEAYVNCANAFTVEGVDYVDFTLVSGGGQVLDTLTSLPAGKTLIINPQSSVMRDTLHNTIGSTIDLSGTEVSMYNIYEEPTFKLEYNGKNIEISLTGYTYNTAIVGTNNMPTGSTYIVKDYANILGLDGTPVNMGYGSYLVVDEATMTIEVYANWSNVYTIGSVDYVDSTSLSGSNVLDTLTSLPTGKILIICPQGTDMRTDLYDGNNVGNNGDITGLTIEIWMVSELS